MLEIRNSNIAVEDTIKLSSSLGNNVFAENGDDLGKAKEFSIDPKTLTIEGVWIDPCITCAKEYVGREYINNISDEGIVLKINPFTEVVGKKVFNTKGEEVGKVTAITRQGKSNNIISIEIDPGFGKENIVVSREMVKSFGESVILATNEILL